MIVSYNELAVVVALCELQNEPITISTLQRQLNDISHALVEGESAMKQLCQNLMMASIFASNTLEAQDQCQEIISTP